MYLKIFVPRLGFILFKFVEAFEEYELRFSPTYDMHEASTTNITWRYEPFDATTVRQDTIVHTSR